MKNKTLFVIFFFFLASYLIGCAQKTTPPPLYRGTDLTLDEIIQKSGGDIDALKVVAEISIDRKSEPFSYFSASALIKRPDQARMRIYKFGLPVNDILIKDETVYIISGKESGLIKKLGKELYHAVFWWDGVKDGVIYREGSEYILRIEDKVIYLSSETLFPIRQAIIREGNIVSIIYSGPKSEGRFWYPSAIDIYISDYILKVRISKLLLNPKIEEYDFRIPDP